LLLSGILVRNRSCFFITHVGHLFRAYDLFSMGCKPAAPVRRVCLHAPILFDLAERSFRKSVRRVFPPAFDASAKTSAADFQPAESFRKHVLLHVFRMDSSPRGGLNGRLLSVCFVIAEGIWFPLGVLISPSFFFRN